MLLSCNFQKKKSAGFSNIVTEPGINVTNRVHLKKDKEEDNLVNFDHIISRHGYGNKYVNNKSVFNSKRSQIVIFYLLLRLNLHKGYEKDYYSYVAVYLMDETIGKNFSDKNTFSNYRYLKISYMVIKDKVLITTAFPSTNFDLEMLRGKLFLNSDINTKYIINKSIAFIITQKSIHYFLNNLPTSADGDIIIKYCNFEFFNNKYLDKYKYNGKYAIQIKNYLKHKENYIHYDYYDIATNRHKLNIKNDILLQYLNNNLKLNFNDKIIYINFQQILRYISLVIIKNKLKLIFDKYFATFPKDDKGHYLYIYLKSNLSDKSKDYFILSQIPNLQKDHRFLKFEKKQIFYEFANNCPFFNKFDNWLRYLTKVKLNADSVLYRSFKYRKIPKSFIREHILFFFIAEISKLNILNYFCLENAIYNFYSQKNKWEFLLSKNIHELSERLAPVINKFTDINPLYIISEALSFNDSYSKHVLKSCSIITKKSDINLERINNFIKGTLVNSTFYYLKIFDKIKRIKLSDSKILSGLFDEFYNYINRNPIFECKSKNKLELEFYRIIKDIIDKNKKNYNNDIINENIKKSKKKDTTLEFKNYIKKSELEIYKDKFKLEFLELFCKYFIFTSQNNILNIYIYKGKCRIVKTIKEILRNANADNLYFKKIIFNNISKLIELFSEYFHKFAKIYGIEKIDYSGNMFCNYNLIPEMSIELALSYDLDDTDKLSLKHDEYTESFKAY